MRLCRSCVAGLNALARAERSSRVLSL